MLKLKKKKRITPVLIEATAFKKLMIKKLI